MSNSNNSRYSSLAESRDSGDSPDLDMISREDSGASQGSFVSNLSTSPPPLPVDSPNSGGSIKVKSAEKGNNNNNNSNSNNNSNNNGDSHEERSDNELADGKKGEKTSILPDSQINSTTSLKIGSTDSAFKKVFK